MKKLLFTLTFLFTLFTNAQDFEHLRSMTKAEAVSFADAIASSVREKLMLWEIDENKRSLDVTYIPVSTDTVALNETIRNGHHIDVKFTNVKFEKFYEGRDVAMEIEGVKKFKFLDVTLKFLDIFPVWKKYFNNQASIEQVRDDYSMKQAKYKTKEVDWRYSLEGNGLYWTIRKRY